MLNVTINLLSYPLFSPFYNNIYTPNIYCKVANYLSISTLLTHFTYTSHLLPLPLFFAPTSHWPFSNILVPRFWTTLLTKSTAVWYEVSWMTTAKWSAVWPRALGSAANTYTLVYMSLYSIALYTQSRCLYDQCICLYTQSTCLQSVYISLDSV